VWWNAKAWVCLRRAADQVKSGPFASSWARVDSCAFFYPPVFFPLQGGQRRAAAGTPEDTGKPVLWASRQSDPKFDIAAARIQRRAYACGAGCQAWSGWTNCPPAPQASQTAMRSAWPTDGRADPEETPQLGGDDGLVAERRRVSRGPLLGRRLRGPEGDFFAIGGRPLARRSLAVLRDRHPQVTVSRLVTTTPRLGSLAGFLDALEQPPQITSVCGATDSAAGAGR